MYLPRHFEETDRQRLADLIDRHPLVHLVQWHGGELIANPIPMLRVEAADGQWLLQGHVARANRMWHATGPDVPALAIVTGPDAYVSPSWYPSKAEHGRVVPTWNYATWHAHGRLRAIEDRHWLRDLLERLTRRHEAGMPKPWSVDDAPADYTETLLKAIVGIELRIERIEAKSKLSQNHPEANQAGVIDGLGRAETPRSGEVREMMLGRAGTQAKDSPPGDLR